LPPNAFLLNTHPAKPVGRRPISTNASGPVEGVVVIVVVDGKVGNPVTAAIFSMQN
jgi:hypothetical protein